MNILMLGSGSYKSSLSFRLIQFGRQLSLAGNTVTAVMPSADKYNGFMPDSTAALEGIHLRQPWQLSTHSAMINLVPYVFTCTLAVLKSRVEVVIIYKPTPVTVVGLIRKLIWRTPVIVDMDDLGSEVMRRQGQGGFRVALVAWCERTILKYADAVVVASSFLKSIVLEQYPDKPVLLLPNGVDVSQYQPPVDLPPRPAVYYFGAIDNLELINDLLLSIPAIVKAVPNAQFTIIGGGKALPEAKLLARKLGISNNVIFTGWTDMFEAQKFTQFGDIGICYQPDARTMRAASNMKVFQYMAMGTVPVVSDVGDLAQYVQHGKAGCVIPASSPDALAAKLVRLLQNPRQRQELANNARQLAETDYAWQTLGTQLDSFIHPIIPEALHA